MKEKIKKLAKLIEEQQIERLHKTGLDSEVNILNCKTKIIEGRKYTKIDIGHCGKYMIDKEGNIFGIKAYGVINLRKNYGTLDTISDYYWGDYNTYKY